jgi:hypothetical protein
MFCALLTLFVSLKDFEVMKLEWEAPQDCYSMCTFPSLFVLSGSRRAMPKGSYPLVQCRFRAVQC